MHAYFLTRGNIYDVDLFIDYLKTRTMMLPFTRDSDGLKGKLPLSMIVRPIQLWEVCFPKEEKDTVLTALKFDEGIYPDNYKMHTGIYALRKALQAEPVPKFSKEKTLFMPIKAMENIQIIPIGVREDRELKDPNGTTHEAI
jgi:hypothetical protein